jgi:hypothetical protein
MTRKTRKVKAKVEKPKTEEPDSFPGIVAEVEEEKPMLTETSVKEQLKAIVAELEADPLCRIYPQLPREYGEKIYPRYQKLMAKLKALAG